MNLRETTVQCPYCWETITLLVDSSSSDQEFVEDCSVCCNPMDVRVRIAGGEIRVDVERAQ